MIKKLIITIGMLSAFFSDASNADNVNGFYFGAGYAEARTIQYGHIDSGGLFEAGYDFNNIYSINTKIVRAGGDNYDLNFLGADIGHDFNSSWIRVYGKIGAAEITAKDAYGYDSEEEYENTQPTTRSIIALGVGVRFTPFSAQRGLYTKLELLAEGGVPLYTPIGLFLAFGYRF